MRLGVLLMRPPSEESTDVEILTSADIPLVLFGMANGGAAMGELGVSGSASRFSSIGDAVTSVDEQTGEAKDIGSFIGVISGGVRDGSIGAGERTERKMGEKASRRADRRGEADGAGRGAPALFWLFGDDATEAMVGVPLENRFSDERGRFSDCPVRQRRSNLCGFEQPRSLRRTRRHG
jgi:hypothetical protein